MNEVSDEMSKGAGEAQGLILKPQDTLLLSSLETFNQSALYSMPRALHDHTATGGDSNMMLFTAATRVDCVDES